MNSKRYLKCLCCLLFSILTACGGGGSGSNNETQLQTLSLQESLRYFPLNDGNLWVSQKNHSLNGMTTSSFTSVTIRSGTKLVGGVVASVISVRDISAGSTFENYLEMDNSGVMVHGNNRLTDSLTAAIVPYRLVSFPIQIGSTFRQIDKSNLDYGRDLDGDGINERIDIRADVTVRDFETVTTAAGAFKNCLRIDTNFSETVTISNSRTRINTTGVESDWYAQDIGFVKQATTFSGNGQSSQSSEELSGYLVNGRSSGLSLQTSPSATNIAIGDTTPLTVTVLDTSNFPLTTVPAVWTSDNTTIATVDSNGLVGGVKSGTAILTPTVGGVAGPSAIFTVLPGFSTAARYPGPEAITYFRCGDTAIGDLNGDGRNDVVVMESFGSRILVYYQNANGTLNVPESINTTLTLSGISVRDINNDGLADLIVSGNSITASSGWLGRVAVYRQNPFSHTLSAAQEYNLSTSTAGTLAIADLNSDNLPDIIIASPGNDNGLLSFLFQAADGTLGQESVLTYVPVYFGAEVHVADMNSDGRIDIVVQSDIKQLAVIKQTAAGVFSASPDFYTVQTNYWPVFNSFALGDLNGDGRMDIITGDLTGTLNLFLQQSDTTLIQSFIPNQNTSEVKISDVDGDGLNDILLISGGYIVRILLQSSNHSFSTVQTVLLPTLTYGGTHVHQAMSVGDVTGDGLPDVVTSWSDQGVYVLPRR